jgi:hypothetical protein
MSKDAIKAYLNNSPQDKMLSMQAQFNAWARNCVFEKPVAVVATANNLVFFSSASRHYEVANSNPDYGPY